MQHIFPHRAEIEKKLQYTFKNPDLLTLAFTHRSFCNESKGESLEHNERLEFLGDSVLALLIAQHLYATLPEVDEGRLSMLRAQLVDAPACACYLHHLGVEDYLLLGKGEQMNKGRGRESVLADLFESIIGAIYLDGGLAAAESFLHTHFSEQIAERISKPMHNWKAELQDYAQKTFHETPHYELLEEKGPEHEKRFRVAVLVGGKRLGEGEGASKKEAQIIAAQAALNKISLFDGM